MIPRKTRQTPPPVSSEPTPQPALIRQPQIANLKKKVPVRLRTIRSNRLPVHPTSQRQDGGEAHVSRKHRTSQRQKRREKPTPYPLRFERNVRMYVAAATTEGQPEKNASSVGPARQRRTWWSPSTPAYPHRLCVGSFVCKDNSQLSMQLFSAQPSRHPLSLSEPPPRPVQQKKTETSETTTNSRARAREQAQYRPAKLIRKKTPPRTSR